jgi:hypothetical protein
MKLQLLTLNDQGLNKSEASPILRNYLQPQLSSLEIVCLQEHKFQVASPLTLGTQFGEAQLIYRQ